MELGRKSGATANWLRLGTRRIQGGHGSKISSRKDCIEEVTLEEGAYISISPQDQSETKEGMLKERKIVLKKESHPSRRDPIAGDALSRSLRHQRADRGSPRLSHVILGCGPRLAAVGPIR